MISHTINTYLNFIKAFFRPVLSSFLFKYNKNLSKFFLNNLAILILIHLLSVNLYAASIQNKKSVANDFNTNLKINDIKFMSKILDMKISNIGGVSYDELIEKIKKNSLFYKMYESANRKVIVMKIDA